MRPSLPIKILLIVAFLGYPFLMLFGLSHWGITPIALVLMVAAILKLLVSKHSQLKPLYILGIFCGLVFGVCMVAAHRAIDDRALCPHPRA